MLGFAALSPTYKIYGPSHGGDVMRYRRAISAGGTFFFTVNLENRSSRLLIEKIEALRESVRKVYLARPMDIVAMVILPDHLHAVWTLPFGDSDYPQRWSLIEASFSKGIDKGEPIKRSRRRKRERGIWQRRYWEHQVLDDDDFERHIDYIHFNPVKHGYVAAPVEWPYSSVHRYVREGILTVDWAAGAKIPDGAFGERG